MNAPKIDWIQPGITAGLLTLIFLTAYGGLRGNDPNGIIHALFWVYIAWADAYITGEQKKGLPRETYLVNPLPRLRA